MIGKIPIAIPTVFSITMAVGSRRLSQLGAITKRMTAIEDMAGMDVLFSDRTGTLTLNKLIVDKNLIEVLPRVWRKKMSSFWRQGLLVLKIKILLMRLL